MLATDCTGSCKSNYHTIKYNDGPYDDITLNKRNKKYKQLQNPGGKIYTPNT